MKIIFTATDKRLEQESALCLGAKSRRLLGKRLRCLWKHVEAVNVEEVDDLFR